MQRYPGDLIEITEAIIEIGAIQLNPEESDFTQVDQVIDNLEDKLAKHILANGEDEGAAITALSKILSLFTAALLHGGYSGPELIELVSDHIEESEARAAEEGPTLFVLVMPSPNLN